MNFLKKLIEQEKKHTQREFKNVSFSFEPETGTYSVMNHQMIYNMPEPLAANLDKWMQQQPKTKDHGFGISKTVPVPPFSEWYENLIDEAKAKVQVVDSATLPAQPKHYNKIERELKKRAWARTMPQIERPVMNDKVFVIVENGKRYVAAIGLIESLKTWWHDQIVFGERFDNPPTMAEYYKQLDILSKRKWEVETLENVEA